jgi:hypothetical protein
LHNNKHNGGQEGFKGSLQRLQKRVFLLFAEEEDHYHLNVTVTCKGEKCVSLKAIGTSLNCSTVECFWIEIELIFCSDERDLWTKKQL